MRILIVGNYKADHQQSMSKFAELLVRIYSPVAKTLLVCPPVLISRLPGMSTFLRKYLAYIDKLIIFPVWLVFRARNFDLIHIADHSNAFYSFCCPQRRCIVTCHDLLAVRGALGDPSAVCSASSVGLWLQLLIMAGLRHARSVVFDSQATFTDYLGLGGGPITQRHEVIPIPLNASFTPVLSTIDPSDSVQFPLPPKPYLLMVGSDLPRKNRALALQLLEWLGGATPYSVVFAGAPLTSAEQEFRNSHPLGKRLLSIVGPSHALLNSLYCHAHALLFPSFAEGFGWPLVEAQTCCCPVIASFNTSIPEVAGEGALYADATDVEGFATHVRALEDPAIRSRLIRLGIANTLRYDRESISNAYRRFAFQL